MPRRFSGSTAVLLLPTALAGLGISTPRLLGQTQAQTPAAATGLPNGPATADQVLRGRLLVASSGCGDCHNRGPDNPEDRTGSRATCPTRPASRSRSGRSRLIPPT